MYETVVKVEGMMCGMCEAHINQAVRDALPVKKVSSSHKKGQTVITSEQPLDEDLVRSTIDATGYRVLGVSKQQAKKKGLFGRH
ncbi:MAG: heavy-metal-associated domain-containing protein [Eggerthellaceae bacterium]|jgi:copper chaperone CopZ